MAVIPVKQLVAQARARQKDPAAPTCEEASPHSREFFIPCGRPAEHFVLSERGTKVYAMCVGCADHNVHNRGAQYVAPVGGN